MLNNEKTESEATKKQWLLRFKAMCKGLGYKYADVARITGNTETTIKGFSRFGVPRNMRFAIELYEKSSNYEFLDDRNLKLVDIHETFEIRPIDGKFDLYDDEGDFVKSFLTIDKAIEHNDRKRT